MKKTTFTFITKHDRETKDFAKRFVDVLKPGDVLALEGDLGAGKTTFAKGLAEGLEISEPIDSPTFTIIKEYQGKIPFFHMDVYRLDSPDEQLGLEEYFYGEGICLIEWASHIAEWLPKETIQIRVIVLANQHRHIEITTMLPRIIKWCEGQGS